MYCLDKWASTNITDNLYGSPETRHDDYREIVIDVIVCKPNKIDGICLNATQAQKEEMLNKIEVAVMYNT